MKCRECRWYKYRLLMCLVFERLEVWLGGMWVTVIGNRTAVEELIDDHETTKVAVDEAKVAVDDLIDRQAENKIAIGELIDDRETFRVLVVALVAWAEALSTKLNADTGVDDTDYDADIAAEAPGVLSAGDQDAAPAVLVEFE